MRAHLRWVPRLIGPAILLYFLLTNDLARVLGDLRDVEWTPLGLALALYPVLVTIKAWRWNALMDGLGMEAPPLREATAIYAVGLFLGGATPGQSGDFLKAWYLRRRGQPLAAALFSVLLDRLFDFLIMALLAVLGLSALVRLLPQQLRTLAVLAAVALAAAVVVALPALMGGASRRWLVRAALHSLPRRPGAALVRWSGQFASLELRPRLCARAGLATLCSAACTMVRLWFCFRALHLAIPAPVFVGSMALISILQSLPISVAGVGVRDAVLIAILGAYGFEPYRALALSALMLLLNLEHMVGGFLVELWHPLARPRGAAAAEAGRAGGEDWRLEDGR
ncbi:MAG TPA: lysylphosphatidylglycerol synthase transmembrane domain-containing protein [Gemmatimonadales bacterium]|nr:lysylphosphatidylglycerol synthase transmembrane domain-containing protein [Gemmatimonadales bacterium]